MIRELAFVCYPVSDLQRARRFYEETLGLSLVWNYRDEWLEFDVGGQSLCLTNMPGTGTPGADGAFVGLEVDDFPAAVERMKAAGVVFDMEPFDTPVCRMAVFRDPDGNGLILHRRHVKIAV